MNNLNYDIHRQADLKGKFEGQQMKSMKAVSTPIEKSNDDPTPVYHKLEKAIQEQIENGHLVVSDRIPPEKEIANLNNVSLATVRKALQNLVQNGFINRIQGKGTYVSTTALRRQNIRYYPLVKSFQSTLPQFNIKFIELKTKKGQQWINRHLKIRVTQDLYELRRVVTLLGNPVVYCVSYLPRNMFEGLHDYKRYYFEKYPLYQFLEEKFGVSTTKNCELFGATLADEHTANLLKVDEGHPLLVVEMQALTYKDKPYEYRISYCLTDEKKIRRFIWA